MFAPHYQGENAQLSSLVGAMAVADLVKTTLGPKGLDKILQRVGDGRHGGGSAPAVSVTNDGATIVRSLHVDNAAAKVLITCAKVQDDMIGDGTTTVIVLAGELLRQAEPLLQGTGTGHGVGSHLHPQTVVAGYQLATQVALKELQQCAKDAALEKDAKNEAQALLRQELLEIAETTLSSKLLVHEKEYFANLAVDAVLRLQGSNNLDHIILLKKAGATLRDSYLEEGFLLDKSVGMGPDGKPFTRLENARILLANTSMDTDKIKMYGSRVQVDSLTAVADIEQAEKQKMKNKVNKMLQHHVKDQDQKLPMNAFINRQLIYNYPESLFREAGVLCIEHADFDNIERLAAVLGGDICSTFDQPDTVTLGQCDVMEQVCSVSRHGR
jgi:T-complex protein 1 subunit beta